MGDIILSQGVARKIQESHNSLLPFSKLANILQSFDFSFANLETPISTTENIPSNPFVFNTPESYSLGLKKYNFSVLNLANNHAHDQGKDGLFHTMDYLKKLGIQYV
jgi:poly-gamma-glutamate synthesis protein (capsule biosynthesis protein)